MNRNCTGSIKAMLMASGIVAATLLLGACREEEQGRPLQYRKGEYAGKPDTQLSAAARRSIQDRVRHQGALGASPGGGTGRAVPSSSADVRPPGNAVNRP